MYKYRLIKHSFLIFCLLFSFVNLVIAENLNLLKQQERELQQLIERERSHWSAEQEAVHLYRLGRIDFTLAIDDEDYLELAESVFERLLEINADKALAEMYLASLHAVKAKHAFLPYKKWNYATEAIDRMDLIVENNPQNFEIRFIRASSYYHLPFFFGKKDQAKEDCEYLVANLTEAATRYPSEIVDNARQFLQEANYLPLQ